MSKQGSEEQKTLFEYNNYRDFLKSFYADSKSQNPHFSFRYFSRLAGLNSPSALKRVMDGKNNLSLSSIEKFAKALKLGKDESRYFKNLVLFNQATSTEEKQKYAQEMMRSRGYRKIHPLGTSQYKYYANWYFSPVRELIGLPEFREDYDWIAKNIIPAITPDQARRAIDELMKLKMVERAADGKLVQVSRIVSTPDEVASSALAQWHKEMMKRAAESIDSIPREERDISSVVLRISKSNLKKAKEIIQQFRRDLVVALSENSSGAIYELNLHLFPLTTFIDGSSGESES